MHRWLGLLAWLVAFDGYGQDDRAALDVADGAAGVDIGTRACPWNAEAAVSASDASPAREREWRASFDLSCKSSWQSPWQVTLANRLDLRRSERDDDDVNTLKEAFVSWRPAAGRYLDVGRVNARYGVAAGYRPTDFFRVGSVRSVVSLDPTSLRENRQGSVMLRGQLLWPNASLTALSSPEISSEPSNDAFAFDSGATNPSTRWLVAFTHTIGKVEPQFMLFDDDRGFTALGVNLTALLSTSIVGYFEWAGADALTVVDQAQGSTGEERLRSQASLGLTWTTERNLSLTFEYDYNGFAPTAAEWDALRAGPASVLARYRETIGERQDPGTRRGLFLQARWEDAFVRQLDAHAFARVNLDDRSRLVWLSLRYHLPALDVGLQWQRHDGEPTSEFGAREGALWQLLFTYYR